MGTPKLQAVDARGKTLDDPTDTEVHDLFSGLNAAWPFAIVTRLDREPINQHFFQIYLHEVGDFDPDADEQGDVEFEVEFRIGSADRHHRTVVAGLDPFPAFDRVNELYRAWWAEDPRLWELQPWEVPELEG